MMGKTWSLTQKRNATGFYLESMDYPGLFLGMKGMEAVVKTANDTTLDAFLPAYDGEWKPERPLLTANLDALIGDNVLYLLIIDKP